MEDNSNIHTVFEDIDKTRQINTKAILYKLLASWKFFLAFTLITFAVAFIYNRYTVPIYEVSCKVLIKDDSKNSFSDQDNLLKEMSLFKKEVNLVNEMGILRSKTLSRKTVFDLNLFISYYTSSKQLKRTLEIYKDCPFTVEIDTSHVQLLNVPINVCLLPNGKYNIKIDNFDNAYEYNFGNLLASGNPVQYYKIDTSLMFGAQFKNQFLSLKLKLNPNFNLDNSRNYYFIINNSQEIGAGYAASLAVAPIEKDASIVELKIRSNVPQKAIDFLNKLSENYIELGLEEKNINAVKTINFIDMQLVGISDSLNSVENLLENFKSENQFIDLPEEAKATVGKLADQDKEKALKNIEIKYYEYTLDYLNNKKDYTDIILPVSMGLADASLNSLVTELITLSQEKNKIAISSTEKNPYYSVIESDIAATKKAAISAVQNSLNIARLTLNDINKKIEETESKVNKLPKKERQLLEIQRKFNLSDDVYNFLLQKKAEASIAKASNISDIKIIDRAELVAKVHPNKSRNYLIALLLGLLIPFLILFIREYLNETIKDKKDIDDNSSLTLLGSIAHSNQKTELALIENPRSLVAETIRILRSNLDFVFVNNNKDEGKIITITSAISAEGKTFCSMNIACAFAISDKKTLLIGADLRKPKIFKDFDLTNNNGLSSYLIGKSSLEEITNETNIKNLYLITAGPVPPNPSELLASDKFIELLSILRKKFDYIIFDTPPAGLVSDAVSVMKHSDTILYVLRQNHTSKKVLIELNDFVNTTGLKNIYLVLNDILYKKNKYGKYYGRYGYSGYGYTYSGYYYEE